MYVPRITRSPEDARELALFRLLYTPLGDAFPISNAQRLLAFNEYNALLSRYWH